MLILYLKDESVTVSLDVAEENIFLLFSDELNNLHFNDVFAVEEKELLDIFREFAF
jgi:hypothetical protein